MYADKSLFQSKKVGVQFMGIVSILLSQFIAARYGIDPMVTQTFIAALVLGHTGTQGAIDSKLAGYADALAQIVTPQASPAPNPLPVPAEAPPGSTLVAAPVVAPVAPVAL